MNTHHEISIKVIEKWLEDSDWRVRAAAMNACNGKDVPLEVIERGLRDSDCDVRAAAMNACNGREMPLEVIERGLRDSDCYVRAAAINACAANNHSIPVVRTIEPPELVYKKCVGGVIVVASIPKDARVRGSFNNKCRASKAVIEQIIGDLCGEPVGISEYDLKTVYYVGDNIEIDNFDFSNAECSTGFHFFCTIEEARNYE